jgi:MFS family permease
MSAASASTESRRGRRGGALAWGLCALGLAMLVTTLVMEATANREVRIEVQYGTYLGAVFWLVSWQSFVIVGALIASRRPGNPIGWISIAAGLATTLTGLTDSYARYALIAQPGSLPGGELAAWFSEWSWVVWIGLVGVFFVLLFPNGRLPSPRWRWLPRLTVAAIVTGVAGIAFRPGPLEEAPYVRSNPLGIEGAEALISVLEVGLVLLPVCILFAGVSMVMRFRRSGGIERLQLKWLAYSVSVVAGLFFAVAFLWNLIPMMVEMNENEDEVVGVVQSVTLVLWAGLPISAGFAILRASALRHRPHNQQDACLRCVDCDLGGRLRGIGSSDSESSPGIRRLTRCSGGFHPCNGRAFWAPAGTHSGDCRQALLQEQVRLCQDPRAVWRSTATGNRPRCNHDRLAGCHQ